MSAGALALVGGTVSVAAPHAAAHPDARAKHVLLLSVDGLHESDLAWWVRHHPDSALASLVHDGVDFTNARTPFPSDSFPGMVGQVTGGNPSSTGVYYDDSYNHALLPPGTTSCTGATPGTEVTYFEQLDINQHSIDAGQGLAGLPGSILQLTSDARSLIDPKQLPVDPATCTPVYPDQYLKVNTIFEVASAAGLRTAWSDKHPAYEILGGATQGVQDFFTPEINSDAPTLGSSNDWTTDNALTMQYDSYKVQAVLNWIKGLNHQGTASPGTPAIFGMNFQTVSTAQKLPTSDGLQGGYEADGVTPGPLLLRALGYIDDQVAAMQSALRAQHLEDSTVVILSAKHGQSPQTPSALKRIDDGAIITALNTSWHTAHPSGVNPLVAFSIDDDGWLMWLNDRSNTATSFAKDFLLDHSGTGNDINGATVPYEHSGLARVFAGEAAADFMNVRPGDARVPDVIGIVQYGVVYTGKKGKIAEHGGDNPQDRHVALVVSGDPIDEHGTVDDRVETTQIAPTILALLGLDPDALRAVQIEHTAVLPVG
ncbi:MAG: alkaline phosphatase family protein [Candidatus Dormibacteraeota bacterium]|nr:alkaline phosphatase family protein [Candidatus Dormibacteraeota bacterium]